MDFIFDLTGICAMSPALPDTVSFLAWAEGDGAFPVKEGRVKSPLVPGMLSRRLLPGDLLAVAAMLSLERLAGLPDAAVFASMTGETPRCVRMLRSVRDTGGVSPAEFSGSVHNSPSGYYSMISGCHASSSSLAGGADTVIAGLSECVSELYGLGRGSVHAVFYENSLPGSLVNVPEGFHGPYAAALSLRRGGGIRLRDDEVAGADGPGLLRLLMRKYPELLKEKTAGACDA